MHRTTSNSRSGGPPEPQLDLGEPISLTGTLERVTYNNLENGFSVLQLKIRGERNLTTVIGSIFSPQPGEVIEAVGQWVMNKDYGRQFKANDLRSVPSNVHRGHHKISRKRPHQRRGTGFCETPCG
jgi:hypothetical protein